MFLSSTDNFSPGRSLSPIDTAMFCLRLLKVSFSPQCVYVGLMWPSLPRLTMPWGKIKLDVKDSPNSDFFPKRKLNDVHILSEKGDRRGDVRACLTL